MYRCFRLHVSPQEYILHASVMRTRLCLGLKVFNILIVYINSAKYIVKFPATG